MSPTNSAPMRIAMLIYPKFTALDLVGPHQVLAGLPGVHVDLIAKTKEPVVSDRHVSITPGKSFRECEADYDILLVPGGTSTHLLIEDAETLAFLARIGEKAAYITSVCAGSLILAAAGLLTGYRATSHWAYRALLADFGAIPEAGRFVVDRNRMTGGGVTAGIDFGLHLASILRGNDAAELIQLSSNTIRNRRSKRGIPKGRPQMFSHQQWPGLSLWSRLSETRLADMPLGVSETGSLDGHSPLTPAQMALAPQFVQTTSAVFHYSAKVGELSGVSACHAVDHLFPDGSDRSKDA